MLNRALLFSMATLLATPALAQDTTTETPAETAATEQSDGASDLNMGSVEQSEPQLGDFYVRETFDDWALRCVRTEEENDPCQLYQLLLDDTGNAIAEVSMFPLPGGGEAAAGATIVVPLETLLTENVKISVDGGPARVYPYSFCNQGGCVARVGFTQGDVNAFKAGNAATVTIVPAAAPDEKFNLALSLKGFTAGMTSEAVQ